MIKAAKVVSVVLAIIGMAELFISGSGAAFYAWYLLFALWMAVLIIRFIMVAISAYKAVFVWASDEKVSFPEFEQRMASFNQFCDKSKTGPRSRANNTTGRRSDANDLFDDDRINPISREDDPFGLFIG